MLLVGAAIDGYAVDASSLSLSRSRSRSRSLSLSLTSVTPAATMRRWCCSSAPPSMATQLTLSSEILTGPQVPLETVNAEKSYVYEL